MSFRSKRSKLTQLTKAKETANQTLEDVVSQVIRDVSTVDDQEEDTPHSINPDTNNTEAPEPSHATVVGLGAGDIRPNKRNGSKKQSQTPSLSQPLANDSQCPSASNRWSIRSHPTDDKPNQDGQTAEPEIGSTGNVWVNEPSMTEPVQATAKVTGYVRRNQKGAAGRPSLTPSPGQPLANDSQRSGASNRWSLRSHRDNQPNQDGQIVETNICSAGNAWMGDLSVTEAAQVTPKVTNNMKRNQKGAAGRPPFTPSPSQTFHVESLDQHKRIQTLENQVHANDGELLQQGNPSEWDNDMELNERDEDIDREPFMDEFPRSHGSNTSKWSNDIQFDEMEEVEMRDSEGKRGKKGGPILPKHVWSLRPGVKFVVPFNSLDQPVRKGGYVLIRFLGDIAKNCELCPIDEANWRKVDKNCKAKIISLLREKFVLPDRFAVEKCILRHIGNKWRNYRHELKTQYKIPDKTREEVANTVPKGIPPSQWVKLVQYWFSEKSEMLCKKGKEARAAQTHFHVTGSKSYARRRDEFEKTHGREPGALEWFVETHQRKDGTFAENTSKEFVDAAAALIAQRGSTSSRRPIAVENQVFSELMYSDEERPYQRPLGYGFGVTGNKLFGNDRESRKRRCIAGLRGETGSSKKKTYLDNGYFPSDSSAEVERLNFAVTTIGETNQLMQGQIKMQSQQLQMQSLQLQTQSKQIEGLQVQLQQVTSLLSKYGAMLNNPQAHRTPKPAFFPSLAPPNRRVPDALPDYSDEESDSTDWDSD